VHILIAGVGNILRGDDGFGVHVARALANHKLPEGVRVAELGISGLALVHEILDGCDACIIVDASHRGGQPGTLYVLRPERTSCQNAPQQEIDWHTTEPGRALALAEAWGGRPRQAYVIACEPQETEQLRDELSAPVAAAVRPAIKTVLRLVEEIYKTHSSEQ